jgi:hypothetical protein
VKKEERFHQRGERFKVGPHPEKTEKKTSGKTKVKKVQYKKSRESKKAQY